MILIHLQDQRSKAICDLQDTETIHYPLIMLFLIAFKAIISTMAFVGKLFTMYFFLTLLPLAQQSSSAHWSVSQDLQSFDLLLLFSFLFVRVKFSRKVVDLPPPP